MSLPIIKIANDQSCFSMPRKQKSFFYFWSRLFRTFKI